MDDLLSEVEQAISLAMITGELPNERLRRTIESIDRGDYAGPLGRIRADVAGRAGVPVATAFVQAMARLREAHAVDMAELQILVIGFYRITWQLLSRLDHTIDLDQIRALDAGQAARLCDGFRFGQQPDPFPVPAAMAERFRGRLRAMMRPADADQDWRELSGQVPRCRPIAVHDHLSGPVANAIRNAFFHEVFREYLGPDNVDDRLRHEHRLVLDFLEDAERHPQLLPFLQGQEPSQVRFRLSQLTLALIAMHQIEAQSGSGRRQARAPLREAAIGCLYAPFPDLVRWVHDHLDHLSVPVVNHGSTRATWTDLDPVTMDDRPTPAKRRSSGSERLEAVR
jgi:hypothetical protein